MAGTDYDAIVQQAIGTPTPGQQPAGTDYDSIVQNAMATNPDEPSAAPAPTPPPTPGKNAPAGKVTGNYAQKVLHAEGYSKQGSGNGSIWGYGQFSDGTWLNTIRKTMPDLAGKSDQELLQMKDDPAIAGRAINGLAKLNTPMLTKAGIPVNDASLYAAHWLGNNAPKVLNADPTTPMTALGLGLTHDQMVRNGFIGKDGQARTAGWYQQHVADLMGEDFTPQHLNLGQALAEGAQNFLPSLGRTAAGAASAVLHPIQTAKGIGGLLNGLRSKIDGYAGYTQDPVKKAQDEAGVDALAKMYEDRYGTLDGFYNAIAHDPAQVMLDLTTVATGGEFAGARVAGALGKVGDIANAASKVPIVGGTMGVLGKGLGVASDVAQTGAKGLGAVGRAANPFNPLGVVSGTAGRVFPTSFNPLTRAGDLTGEAEQALSGATNGMMNGEDIANLDPAAREGFLQAMRERGISADTAREGILRGLGLKAPTSVVTLTQAPEMAAERVREALGENNADLSKIGSDLSGAQAPHPTALAEALENAHVNSINGVTKQYKDLEAFPGTFGLHTNQWGEERPAGIGEAPDFADIHHNVAEALGYGGLNMPNTMELLSQSSKAYPQASAAMKLLDNTLSKGNTLLGGELDAPELMEIRRQLSDLTNAASGTDLRAMRGITDAFHKTIEDAADRGDFVDLETGEPVQGFSQGLRDANAAYKKHFDTFENTAGVNAPIAKAVRTMKAEQSIGENGERIASGDSGAQMAAQKGLGDKLMDPAQGPAVYDKLKSAIGPQNDATVDDFVRQHVLASDPTQIIPNNRTDALLKASSGKTPSTVAERALGAKGLAQAKMIRSAARINNARPVIRKPQMLMGQAFGRVLGRVGVAAAGYHMGHLPGLIVGEAGERMLERALDKANMAAAFKGTPKPKGALGRGLGRLATRLTSPGTVIPANIVAQSAANGFNKGGVVKAKTHEELVTRLMNAAEKAKKVSNEATKPLLKASDDGVAKALAVANRAI